MTTTIGEMYRQVLLLSVAQALFQTGSVLVVTVAGLAGSLLTSPEWATAPMATMMLGTTLATLPASALMSRWGRRPGFILGALLGTAGGLTAAAGMMLGSMVLLCLGTLLVGAYQGFAQFYRFAASEMSSEAFRPRAIAFVLGGGVAAAFLGPLLARLGGPLMQPHYLGSFLLLALVSLVAAALLAGLRMPPPAEAEAGGEPARRLRQVVFQPTYLVAVFSAATGGGVMVLAMTATPIAMAAHHHGLAETAGVIQLHVLGMFLPSFVTGSLIARFGVLKIMFTGVLLFVGHVLLSLSGTEFLSFASALVLLGVGWNFLYIGGTTLLTRTYRASERAKAQSTNDLMVFVVGLIASLAAGVLHARLGWQAMNLLLMPWLAVAAAAILWLGLKQRRMAPAL